jgi:hypothetical protein
MMVQSVSAGEYAAAREDAVVDAGSARVVDVDDRVALVDREPLGLHDRVGHDGPDRPGGHGRVVRNDDDRVPVGRTPSGDDAAAGAPARRAQRRHLDEGAVVDEHLGPLTRRVDALALGFDPGEPILPALRERRAVIGLVRR